MGLVVMCVIRKLLVSVVTVHSISPMVCVVSGVSYAPFAFPDGVIASFCQGITVRAYVQGVNLSIDMALPELAASSGIVRPTCDFLKSLCSPGRDLICILVLKALVVIYTS